MADTRKLPRVTVITALLTAGCEQTRTATGESFTKDGNTFVIGDEETAFFPAEAAQLTKLFGIEFPEDAWVPIPPKK